MIRSSFTVRIRAGARRQLTWISMDRGITKPEAIRAFLRNLLEGVNRIGAEPVKPGLTIELELDAPKAVAKKKRVRRPR